MPGTVRRVEADSEEIRFSAFIAQYPFKPDEIEREWLFSMTDPIMECNQGNFLLRISKEGKGKAVKTTE